MILLGRICLAQYWLMLDMACEASQGESQWDGTEHGGQHFSQEFS